VVKPLLWVFLACRSTYYFCMRFFVCEPLFKAYCKRYGSRLHTGVFIHFIQGRGDILLGDDVRIDGKCTFTFARRFVDRPVLQVGNNTAIGHGCEFVVGKQITIGSNCTLSGTTVLFDSNGHPSDPAARMAREAPVADDVRPIVIGDGVWIGRRCLIFPGVRIGEGSVVSAGSVVRTHVPPFSVVAGNPAKVLLRLKRPDQTGVAVDNKG
jgi:acetyltransferase-like isoleucine patch superfamily enzyme